MISTDITNKNTSKAKGGNDTPVGLALYLLYGLSNDPKVELNRVKYKGSINCATSDLIQSAEEKRTGSHQIWWLLMWITALSLIQKHWSP